jgi:hypothetical protein
VFARLQLRFEFMFTTGDTDIQFIKITAVNAQSLVNNPLP